MMVDRAFTDSSADADRLPVHLRSGLVSLAETLLPRYRDMPSFSEAGADGEWLDHTLRVRQDLLPELTRGLAEADQDRPREALRHLEERDPPAFSALILAVTGAYFMSPIVRQALGYPGQVPNPATEAEVESYLSDDILEVVRSRGPLYRSPPSVKEGDI